MQELVLGTTDFTSINGSKFKVAKKSLKNKIKKYFKKTQPNNWRDDQILVNITTKNLTTVWQQGNHTHLNKLEYH